MLDAPVSIDGRQNFTINDRYSNDLIPPQAPDGALHSYAIEFEGVPVLTVSLLQAGYDPVVGFDGLCYEAAHLQSVRLPSGQVIQAPVPARVHGELILTSSYGPSGYEVLDVTRDDDTGDNIASAGVLGEVTKKLRQETTTKQVRTEERTP